jgi:hypothetical protein
MTNIKVESAGHLLIVRARGIPVRKRDVERDVVDDQRQCARRHEPPIDLN